MNSLVLGLLATFFAIMIGLTVGIISALKQVEDALDERRHRVPRDGRPGCDDVRP